MHGALKAATICMIRLQDDQGKKDYQKQMIIACLYYTLCSKRA